jgi:hypothetical protein
VVSQKSHLLEFPHQVTEQILLVGTVFSSDDDVHVAAGRFPSAVGAADFEVVVIQRRHELSHNCLDELEHLCDFLSRDLGFQLFMVLQAELLVFRQQIGPRAKFSYGSYAVFVDLLGLAGSHSPNFAELAQDHCLL